MSQVPMSRISTAGGCGPIGAAFARRRRACAVDIVTANVLPGADRSAVHRVGLANDGIGAILGIVPPTIGTNRLLAEIP
jgi:hypothetical protein